MVRSISGITFLRKTIKKNNPKIKKVDSKTKESCKEEIPKENQQHKQNIKEEILIKIDGKPIPYY